MQTTEKEQQAKYSAFVECLAKPGHHITSELYPEDAHRIHMAMGVAGEAGELLDTIKKSSIYRKPYDLDNITEECGDILFYLVGMLNSFGVTLEDALKANMDKLSVRYSSGKYSNEQANERADKEAK